jgi:N-acetylglucosamine kinase-like BadF-type ATPase
MNHLYAPTSTPADVAGFAATVVDLGGRGDAEAGALVTEAVAELVAHVRVLSQTLRLVKPPLALSGGVLRSQVRTQLLAALHGEVGPVNHVTDPVVGAIALARRLLRG